MSLVGHIVDRLREGTGWKRSGPPLPPAVTSDLLGPCSRCAELARERSISRTEAGYWKAMHAKALEREAALRKQVEELEAKVKLRERQLFEKKSERKGRGHQDGGGTKADSPKRKRGQQPGAKGHGRRDNTHLPVVDELHDLAEDKQECPCWYIPALPRLDT